MDNQFFERPILNSPYEGPTRHWELDADGQPTQRIIETRRSAQFISPIPKPRKRKDRATQQELGVEGDAAEPQKYDPTPVINELRYHVDQWRRLPNPSDWSVTPETARLLHHWRHHPLPALQSDTNPSLLLHLSHVRAPLMGSTRTGNCEVYENGCRPKSASAPQTKQEADIT